MTEKEIRIANETAKLMKFNDEIISRIEELEKEVKSYVKDRKEIMKIEGTDEKLK